MKKFLSVLIALLLMLSLCGCYEIDSTNQDDYAAFYEKSDEIALVSDLLPLPENIESFDDILLYYSDYDLIDSYHTIYLNCNFSDENFETEKQRAIDYGNELSDFSFFNSDSFSYDSVLIYEPTTLINDELHHIYTSYALFDDENNKIIYVMIFEEGTGVLGKSSTIPDEYLPKELLDFKK